jgi:uncharacterized membrane protein
MTAAASGRPTATAAVLIAATVLTGMSTGVIALYAHTIMPGLKRTDDRTLVGSFQAIDRAIINPWFMGTFFGALILIGTATLLHLDADRRSVLPWLAAALALYLAVVIITMAVHVPLNDAIKRAGSPDRINVTSVRAEFNESKWATWNYFRFVASFGAFVILTAVLTIMKRT